MDVTREECGRYQAALSALADGEDLGMAEARLRIHVAGCADCQTWAVQAAAVTRRVRIRPAEAVPDLTAAIVAALSAAGPPAASRASRHRPGLPVPSPNLLRGTLALIALAQVAVALPALLGNDLGAPLHVAHEDGAWTLALAAALALGAWRPARAAASLPILAVFVGCLSLLTFVDIVGGRTTPAAELPHLMTALGLGLLWLESRVVPVAATPPGVGRPYRLAA